MAENERQRLSSWKEIASYLGRDVRTVLRWEKQRGLPVHRVPGATGRVVFAYTDELDAWVRSASTEKPEEAEAEAAPGDIVSVPPRRSSRLLALSAAAVVLLGVVAAAAVWKTTGATASSAVTRVTATDNSLQGRAADGSLLWTYGVGRTFLRDHTRTAFVDLNGDGYTDTVTSLIVDDGTSGHLVALDHHGRKLWEHVIHDTLTFGRDSYGPTWGPDALIAYNVSGQPAVAWAVHHHTWWPSLMVVFNGRGDRTATFVNSGWIRSVIPTQSGKYILAGGINNARNGAAFAILDARQPGGASPEDQDSKYACRNCPSGVPVRYYVIQWSDIIDTVELGGRRGQPVSFPDGTIELRAVQRQNAEMIVELTPEFEIKKRSISDGFWDWHRRLEQDGVLKHTRAQCPFRNGPTMLEWMPEHGWRELKP